MADQLALIAGTSPDGREEAARHVQEGQEAPQDRESLTERASCRPRRPKRSPPRPRSPPKPKPTCSTVPRTRRWVSCWRSVRRPGRRTATRPTPGSARTVVQGLPRHRRRMERARRGPLDAGAAFRSVHQPIVDEMFKAARAEGRREPYVAYAFDAFMELVRRAAEPRRRVGYRNGRPTRSSFRQEEAEGEATPARYLGIIQQLVVFLKKILCIIYSFS